MTDVTLQERGTVWTLKLSGKKDQIFVKWALGKRKPSFREVFGVDLELD